MLGKRIADVMEAGNEKQETGKKRQMPGESPPASAGVRKGVPVLY